MARLPSLTREEAETIIGPRGALVVTTGNRTAVRKWLVACGVPSAVVGNLPMAILQASYNDTRDVELNKLAHLTGTEREAIATVGEHVRALEGDDEADETTNSAAAQAEAERLAEATRNRIAHKANGANGTATTAHDAQTQRIIAAITAAVAALPPAIDPEEVKRVAQAAALDAVNKISLTADAIRALVAEEAPKHVMVHRVELKAATGEVTALDGHHHPNFASLLRAAGSRQQDGYRPNVWLSGPAGSGKTHAAKMTAKALGLPFHYNGALSMPHELLGFIDAGGTYHTTPFRQAYEGGGVYLFDEVDGSDNSALLALNAALANGTATFPNGQARRHPDSCIIATANTWGLGATADYVGRSKIDAAFLSRFPVRIGWDYDEHLERAICGNADFAKRVQKARGKARKTGLKILIDPRASIAGAALIASGFSSDEAAGLTYLANLSDDQRRMVEA